MQIGCLSDAHPNYNQCVMYAQDCSHRVWLTFRQNVVFNSADHFAVWPRQLKDILFLLWAQ